MAYSRQQAVEFWFQFDTAFKDQPSIEVVDLFRQLFPQFNFSALLDRWRLHRRQGTYPNDFVTELEPRRAAAARLGELQNDIIVRHFGSDDAAVTRAFEDFGQGVLWDDRRPAGEKLHMMDTGGVLSPPIGYHRWHVFARLLQLFGEDSARWLELNRNIALAWAIQSELRPIPDRRDNAELPTDRLNELRTLWLQRTGDELDVAFDSFPYPPARPFAPLVGVADGAAALAAPTNRIAHVKEILESLVGGQNIGLHGNFWRNLATGDDFVNYHVFGDPDLALLVRGDAQNSNLVKALEGRAPFDETLYPRMPAPGLHRRYATNEEIAFIRQWIDDGCPDDPPSPVGAGPISYSDVQAILEAATGTGNPRHEGRGRFWRLSLAQFKQLKVPYNSALDLVIPDNGAGSPLVRVLRGQLPGVPRMPLGRPPVPAADIARIEQWIDAGMQN